ncbi:MAG: ferritin-like domain-containing protein [Synergistaceae bacterium]|nr:ferritin-like domain-containing protein [Synergistaceae bacterium]
MAYAEPYEKMDSKTLDISRAITSLREELEAVDWYNQRVATAADEELKRIMAHNRDEEKEHAAMLVEWIRRNMDEWDKELKDYLFTAAPLGVHESGAGEDAPAEKDLSDLGIGKL